MNAALAREGEHEGLEGFPGGREIRRSAVPEVPCDILVPAALGCAARCERRSRACGTRPRSETLDWRTAALTVAVAHVAEARLRAIYP